MKWDEQSKRTKFWVHLQNYMVQMEYEYKFVVSIHCFHSFIWLCWQSVCFPTLNSYNDNVVFNFRLEVQRVRKNQLHIENKGIFIFLLCIAFAFLALLRMLTELIFSVYGSQKSRKFCSNGSSWFYLLLSSSITLIILSL